MKATHEQIEAALIGLANLGEKLETRFINDITAITNKHIEDPSITWEEHQAEIAKLTAVRELQCQQIEAASITIFNMLPETDQSS